MAFLAKSAGAQGREFQLHLGRSWAGGRATAYEVRSIAPLGAAVSHGVVISALIHDRLGRNRAFYGAGYEFTAHGRRDALRPYAVLSAGLGLSTDTTKQALGALWSVGAGLEWRPLSWLAVLAEGRYRVEDRGPRGFWRLSDDARKGFGVSAGIALARGRGSRQPRPARAAWVPPEPPANITGNAAAVVRTALDALGSPYKWGGSAENGFDCSGLIQYAYALYGVRLPRTSREQSRVGVEVTPASAALQPGDILLFAAAPGRGVTHVGMYVGENRFVHSSSTGVRLSRLDPGDPEASWWLPRWVGARRVIP
jgi:cell wall-associated NlpC family hydrolase